MMGRMSDARIELLPSLVVRTDPVAVTRVYRPRLIFAASAVVLTASLAVLIAALTASESGARSGATAAIPLLICIVGFTMIAMQSVRSATLRSAPSIGVRLDHAGLSATLPQGTLVLPWQAVRSAEVRKRGRHSVLTFRLSEGLTAQSPGVQSSVPPKAWRSLTKKGFRIGSAGVDVPVQTIVDVAVALTNGRLAVT